MDNKDRIRLAVESVLCGGFPLETKVQQILHLFEVNSPSGVIVGWLEAKVRKPKQNQYVDIMLNDKTILFERLYDEQLDLRMRREDLLWRPHFAGE